MKCTADEPLVVMDAEYEPVMLQNPKSFKAEIVERNEGRGLYLCNHFLPKKGYLKVIELLYLSKNRK